VNCCIITASIAFWSAVDIVPDEDGTPVTVANFGVVPENGTLVPVKLELEPEEKAGMAGVLLVPLIRQLQPNMPAMLTFMTLFGHFEAQPVFTSFNASVQVVGEGQVFSSTHVDRVANSASVGVVLRQGNCFIIAAIIAFWSAEDIVPDEDGPPVTDATFGVVPVNRTLVPVKLELEPEEEAGMAGVLLVPLIRQLQPNMPAMMTFMTLFGHFEAQPVLTSGNASVQVFGEGQLFSSTHVIKVAYSASVGVVLRQGNCCIIGAIIAFRSAADIVPDVAVDELPLPDVAVDELPLPDDPAELAVPVEVLAVVSLQE
jgi:hypothetical protein